MPYTHTHTTHTIQVNYYILYVLKFMSRCHYNVQRKFVYFYRLLTEPSSSFIRTFESRNFKILFARCEHIECHTCEIDVQLNARLYINFIDCAMHGASWYIVIIIENLRGIEKKTLYKISYAFFPIWIIQIFLSKWNVMNPSINVHYIAQIFSCVLFYLVCMWIVDVFSFKFLMNRISIR